MRRRHLKILALVLSLGLLAAACGDGEETGAEATATPSENGGSEGIESLASEFENTDARVAYTMENEAEGETQNGEFELFWRASENQWRMDLTFEDEGTTTMISAGDGTIICDHNQESCFRMPEGQQSQVPLPFLGEALRAPEEFGETLGQNFAGTDFDQSSRTIAGREATCFSSSNEQGDFEICFSDDGLLLAWSFDGDQGTSVLEATEVGDVPDDAFDPPYDVEDIQAPPGGGPGQPQPQP